MNWAPSVFAMEIRKILAYRSDFWVSFLGQTFIQLLVARALWQNIFESQGTSSMNGYDLPTLTLYYLLVPVGSRMLTGENIGFISREIYDGTFTRYLIYPLSVFQYKAITYLTHSLFYGLQYVTLYFLYHFFFLEGASITNVATGVSMFLLASFGYVMLAMCIELVALWADNIWSLMVMLRFFTSFFGGGFVPLDFFPAWAQELLGWTPFPYLISLPIQATMGRVDGPELIQGLIVMVGWGLIFMGLLRFIWKKGQMQYTGVGI